MYGTELLASTGNCVRFADVPTAKSESSRFKDKCVISAEGRVCDARRAWYIDVTFDS
jgi:hypothetical protein